jgi:hypothetical protein
MGSSQPQTPLLKRRAALPCWMHLIRGFPFAISRPHRVDIPVDTIQSPDPGFLAEVDERVVHESLFQHLQARVQR